MAKVKTVTIENVETKAVRKIKSDFLYVEPKTNIFTMGKIDESSDKLVCQMFSSYKFSVIDVEYE